MKIGGYRLCNIRDIQGNQINNWDPIGPTYNGRANNSCNVSNVINQVRSIWNSSFQHGNFPTPSNDDIILIESNTETPDFIVYWSDGSTNECNRIAGYTFSKKKKILLTQPLPSNKSSCQVLSHELGHWCFDRCFDEIIGDVPRTGDRYFSYSEACAFFIEESITGIPNNCQMFNRITQRNYYEGCNILRRLQNGSHDIFKDIFYEYQNFWRDRSDLSESA